MSNGLVIKSTGSSYLVWFEDETTLECHVKGNFRIRGIRSTNPVAVGDRVAVETLPDGTNWITEIADRKNYIIRRATNLSKESHILAANLDRVAIVVTLYHPVTSTTFIDRFLATAEAYRVPAVLVFNKIDLLTPEQQDELAAIRALYESLGYPTYAISALNLKSNSASGPTSNSVSGLTGEAGPFQGVTLLAGNSGVGKSTLLNALFGCEKTRTGQISDAHDKGMHTTTFSEMYQLPLTAQRSNSGSGPTAQRSNSGSGLTSWIIDTPGIKGFGAVQMEKEEISHYFREIFAIGRNCRYGNCLHTGDAGCAVYDAVVDGRIAVSRYESYVSLLGDCTESKYR